MTVHYSVEKANAFIEENKDKVHPQYRLNYHLMGAYGWINDPNGFVYYNGEYHMFYQYHPYDSSWGPMHWGHAVSKDMVKWQDLPVALAPDSKYDKDGCFSGSSIEKDDKLYIMYTGHVYTGTNKEQDFEQTQCIAYSNDGIHFTKLKNNPVISNEKVPENASKKDFRDPKVFKEGETYYALVGSHDGYGNGQALIYTSKDLLNWEFLNTMAKSNWPMKGTWECPDIFRMQDKAVLLASPQCLKVRGNDFHNLHSSVYMISDFDMEQGTFEYHDFYPIDYGFDFYAPQTMCDNKGRRIVMAWMDMWESFMPTQTQEHNWAGAMSLPRKVLLKEKKLYFRPIEEIKNYRKNGVVLTDMKIDGDKQLEIYGDSYELQAVFEAKDAELFGLKLRTGEKEETVLSYSCSGSLIKLNRDKSGIGPKGERKTEISLIEGKLFLQIFVDKSSIEIFMNHGEKVMTGRIYPDEKSVGIKAFSKGECRIISLKKWDLVL